MFTTSINIGLFASDHEANKVLHSAEQLIKVYGHVSFADMLDLCEMDATYKDTKIGWTETAFKNAKIRAFYEGYSISMPKCDWCYDASVAKASDEQPQPEPINITIPAEKSEIIKEIINSLCNNLEKIKDRPVFINIM